MEKDTHSGKTTQAQRFASLARRSYNLAQVKNPGCAVCIDTLGWALFQNGQIERALQVLRDARLRAPGDPEIHFHLASVLAKSGRSNEAREELEAALKSGRPFEGVKEAEGLLRALR